MASFKKGAERTRKALRGDARAEWALAHSLADGGDPRAVNIVLDLLNRHLEDPQHQGRDTIVAMGAVAVPPLLDLLRPRREMWTEGVRELLEDIGEQAVPDLLRAMHDKKLRDTAIRALAKIGDRRAVPPLIELVTDGARRGDVRATAIWALGRIGDPSALPVILDVSHSSDKDERRSAAYALHSMGGDAVPRVTELLADPDMDVRQSAVLAAQHLDDARLVPALREMVEQESDSHSTPAHSAAGALRSCGSTGTAALLELLGHRNPRVRSNAAAGLKPPPPSTITDEATIRALVEALPQEGGGAVVWPLITAERIRLAVDLLLPLLDHADAEIRSRAVTAIWVHRDADVVAKLTALLQNDPDDTVRADAAWGLGVAAGSAAYDVLRLAADNDPSEAVRAKADTVSGWKQVRRGRTGGSRNEV